MNLSNNSLKTPPILDPCCGSRMMWFDKADQRCLFGDSRDETHLLKDRQYLRHLEIKPDVQLDFTALPFSDGQFKLVVLDPPHLVHAGQKSWLAKKYGTLGKDWREDLRLAFAECFRVLENEGILIFKPFLFDYCLKGESHGHIHLSSRIRPFYRLA